MSVPVNRAMPRSLDNERGLTLVFTLLLLVGLLILTVAGLVSATSDLRISRNYTTGLQAVLAAEAGVLHAQSEINGRGVIRFDDDVVAEWSTFFGLAPRTVNGYPSVTYTVAAASDAALPGSKMTLTSTGRAPDEAERSIEANLELNGVFSPGAIYLPASGVATSFVGNNFLIDGNDTNLDGTLTGDTVPGIGVPDETSAEAVRNSLNTAQEDNVIGTGGDESILTAAGPSVTDITGDIVGNILGQAGVVTNPMAILSGLTRLLGNATLGTLAVPQITHFTGNLTISGTVSGAGILIVDGGLKVTGDMDFTGLIIVQGTTEITSLSGNSTLVGSLWTTDLTLDVSGSASVTYSREALELSNGIGLGQLLPQRIKLVGWREL